MTLDIDKAATAENPPVYYAVLTSAIRNNEIKYGERGHYEKVERDDPRANEFRAEIAYFRVASSIPLGSDRRRAECVIEKLNAAFLTGQEYAKAKQENPKTQTILVGRMGHTNRNEELMP